MNSCSRLYVAGRRRDGYLKATIQAQRYVTSHAQRWTTILPECAFHDCHEAETIESTRGTRQAPPRELLFPGPRMETDP
jgi:hypothetical protein